MKTLYFILFIVIPVIILISTIVLISMVEMDKEMAKNNEKNKHGKNNKIKTSNPANKKLIKALAGGEEDKVFTFFINRNNIKDIKLPYQFLSPQKAIDNNKCYEFDISRNQYIQVVIFNNQSSMSLTYDFALLHKSRSYSFSENLIPYNFERFDIIYNEQSYINDFDKDHLVKSQLIDFINQYDASPQTLIDFYIQLVKHKQPSYDKMCEIIDHYEEAKEEFKNIKIANRNETLNKMLEDNQDVIDQNDDDYLTTRKEVKNLLHSLK